MTPTELTTIAGVVIALVGSVVIPLYLFRRKNEQSRDHTAVMDSRAVAAMFKDERDRLQVRLDGVIVDYEKKIADLKTESERALAAAEAKWRAQSERDQARIAELKSEIEGLYRRLADRER